MTYLFDPTHYQSYPELHRLISEFPYMIWQGLDRQADGEWFVARIAEATLSGKMAVFHNIDFISLGLTNHHFEIPVLFSQCRFQGDCRFTHNQFLYKLFFHNVIFEKAAKFKSSIFFHGLALLQSECHGEVSFERAKFLSSNVRYLRQEALEEPLRFDGRAYRGRSLLDFLGVNFGRNVSFLNAHFGCSTLFGPYEEKVTLFRGEADFSCVMDEEEELIIAHHPATHQKTIKTLKLDVFHRFTFDQVECFAAVSFENRAFQKKTQFASCIFHIAPGFHNAELHQDTHFNGTSFRDTASEGAARAYRTLKLVMDKKRSRREEAVFFALEQRCLLHAPLKPSRIIPWQWARIMLNNIIIWLVFSRKERELAALYQQKIATHALRLAPRHAHFAVSVTEKLLSVLYYYFSYYGQHFNRPLWLLVVTAFLLFPPLYYGFFAENSVIGHNLGGAYQLSLQQLFRPFELYAVRFREHYPDTPIWLYIIATIQSLMNVGLITLFALAVRGRFRMY